MSQDSVRTPRRKPFCPLPVNEEFLDAFCKTLLEGVLVIDPSSRVIVYWNLGAERLFGYRAAEMLEQPADRCFPDGAAFDRLYELIIPEISKNNIWQGQWEFRHRTGSCFTAEVTATLLASQSGSYLSLVTREPPDGSERPAMKDQLRQSEHMAAIGTAAAMLAHEIKNPLNGISTTVQLLERSLTKTPPTKEAMMGAVRDLENEIGRLQALLGDFQTISLPPRLNLQPVDVAQIAREITAVAIEECKNRKIDMSVEVPGDLPRVEADPERLKQALVNLVKNSCEAMPKGGTLTLKGYVCNHELCVDVTDTGEGIPEGLQIFDLFTSTKAGGTGLGLVIVQQTILAHGGSVTFSSQPGKGTTFRLRLRTIEQPKA
jgi:PAS domain S-box-containing protein